MLAPSELYSEKLARWFKPGAVHTFVGAGGKSTAMKSVASFLARSGLTVRMTTTTRVGIEEFAGVDVRVCGTRKQMLAALTDEQPVLLMVTGETHDRSKYFGLPPDLLECLPLPPHVVLLVEGDGARRLPMKAPRGNEPSIPADSSAVFALMGASAFGEPVDSASCYNDEGARSLLAQRGGAEYRFGPEEIAFLAASREGFRKGVLPGMDFHVLVNQADREERRPIASEAVRLMNERFGLQADLISFLKEEIYGNGRD